MRPARRSARSPGPTGTKLGHDGALAHLFEFLRGRADGVQLIGVGHRVVHGGMEYTQPVRVDATRAGALDKFVPLAPLHQPHNLAAIRAVMQRSPDVPQVACFDTAFHRTNPEIAQMFALPYELHEAGVRRYGFHGLSYEYIASVLPGIDARAAQGRTVVLHLGNGASMCALNGGTSVASTMGFTAVDGLPMGTRTGNLDPGVVLFLMDERGMDARAIEKLLYQQSGLLGVSGIASDMRTLAGEHANRARNSRSISSSTASGANWGRSPPRWAASMRSCSRRASARTRPRSARAICQAAAWLGVELDAAANTAGGPRISTAASRVAAWTIPTNEELMIARHTERLLAH